MTANRRIFLNIVATYGRSRPLAISAALQSGYALVVVLWPMDVDWVGDFTVAEMV